MTHPQRGRQLRLYDQTQAFPMSLANAFYIMELADDYSPVVSYCVVDPRAEDCALRLTRVDPNLPKVLVHFPCSISGELHRGADILLQYMRWPLH
jgi:hypothetical protein